MVFSVLSSLTATLAIGAAIASPVNINARANPQQAQLTAIQNSLKSGQISPADAAAKFKDLLLQAKPASPLPKDVAEFQARRANILPNYNGSYDFMSYALSDVDAGAAPITDLIAYAPVGPVCPGINCDRNNNPAPRCNIYPRKAAGDAPYSLSEEKLRGAIYIPQGFNYGRDGKQPVLLVPGTASYGGVNFQNNFAKILRATDYADPLWLNIPGAQLADIQLAGEYTAYALNYIQCQSGRSVAALGWSQASINYQWAFKYWPSTRAQTTDAIAISGDYHGTLQANLLCALLPCNAAVLQQEYTSKFISTLRNRGGDSSYVPTTNVYTTFDEIVQPQIDPFASGATNDIRGVGVTNTQIQTVCGARPGGSLYGHAEVLYNPIAVALALDALQNPGPGRLSRLNVDALCAKYIADGLTLEDALLTSGLIPLAGFYLINGTIFNPSFEEPPIKAYAQ